MIRRLPTEASSDSTARSCSYVGRDTLRSEIRVRQLAVAVQPFDDRPDQQANQDVSKCMVACHVDDGSVLCNAVEYT